MCNIPMPIVYCWKIQIEKLTINSINNKVQSLSNMARCDHEREKLDKNGANFIHIISVRLLLLLIL